MGLIQGFGDLLNGHPWKGRILVGMLTCSILIACLIKEKPMECPYKTLKTYKITYTLDGIVYKVLKKGCTLVEVGEHFERTLKGFITSIREL